MVSLYVCDFPQDLSSEALANIFNKFDGFMSARCAYDRKGQRIAFIDYREVKQAQYAQQCCQGYRFDNNNRGINVRISDNSKRLHPELHNNQQRNQQGHNRANQNNECNSNTFQSVNSSESRSEFSSPNKQANQNKGANSYGGQAATMQNYQAQPQRIDAYGGTQQNESQNAGAALAGAVDMSNLNLQAVQSLLLQLGDQTDPVIQLQVQNIQGLINDMQPGPQAPQQEPVQVEQKRQAPPVIQRHDERPIQQNSSSSLAYRNLFESDSDRQSHTSSVQASSAPVESNQNTLKQEYQQPAAQYQQPLQTQPAYTQSPYQQQAAPVPPTQTTVESQVAQSLLQTLQSTDSINALANLVQTLKPLTQQQSQPEPQPQPQPPQIDHQMRNLSEQFPLLMQYPKNATKTVYVEGLPHDTTEREMAHIFRPYPGFKQLRLVPRETKDGHKVHFCFADFDTIEQTTLVVNTLQGYRFHKDDIIGLQFSFAVAGGFHHNRHRGQ